MQECQEYPSWLAHVEHSPAAVLSGLQLTPAHAQPLASSVELSAPSERALVRQAGYAQCDCLRHPASVMV